MADDQKVLELIEQAEKEGSTELDLSDSDLTALPSRVTELNSLTHLLVGGNLLTGLPPEIVRLTSLSNLFLWSNLLKGLPEEITELTNLCVLDLRRNQLIELPSRIGNLTNLISLDLDNNELTRLPPEIANLNSLIRLQLRNNHLTTLPKEIGNLTHLSSLDVYHNRLKTLPSAIAELTNLDRIDLRNNELTSLPREFAKLNNLTYLDLRGNHLASLPQEITVLTALTYLDLSFNKLTSLPPEVTKLTRLMNFDLRGNQLPIPPETLADPADVKTIFAAIAGLQSGERLNEAKMLVVGDGKAGKSSVVEQLIHGTFNPKKQTTLGVDLDEMQVLQSEVKGEGEPVKLNIWDFGGQEIQHSTHQFFLTTRSLYVLVVDARKGDQIGNIEYWLKLIESFGGDSPIVIVINQIDQLKGQRPLNLDRKALQEKYNIPDFIETSCETGEGIPALKEAIAREVERLKHVHDFWPREWLAIKRRLKEERADYIPVEAYYKICGEESLNDGDIREFLLGLLHDLGVVIRFPGDTQVLNPRWVTQGVYGLLTSAELVKAQGRFDLKDVGNILASLPDAKTRYPQYTHERLIKVMKHFELCFEFTNREGHYLIPRHLHDNELDIPWDDADALKFQYHFVETLPDSIISRFIVRMNQYIERQYYWKNGVFLRDGENRAKIKADLVDRRIFITIIGKEHSRRAFLAVIRSAFEEINRNFKIEIRQMIPVPGFPQVLVSYKELLVHEEMNEPEIVIPELRKKVSVRELLDGVEELSTRMQRRERDFEERRFPERVREDEVQRPSPHPLPQVKNNPVGSLMSFVFAFVFLLAAIVAAAVAISKWVSVTAGVMTSVVMIAALLAIGIVGAMQLRNDDRISEEGLLKVVIESYKRLPLLRGKSGSE